MIGKVSGGIIYLKWPRGGRTTIQASTLYLSFAQTKIRDWSLASRLQLANQIYGLGRSYNGRRGNCA